jgi:glycolate oxidase FAD binding subunit
VKNVSGFDVCRLLVGSQGTLGFLGEVILRTRPIAPVSQWFRIETSEPMTVFAAVHRPVCMLWDGVAVHVLLEGHPVDIDEQASAAHLRPSEPPVVPPARTLVRPAETLEVTGRLEPGGFLAELGVGVVRTTDGVGLPVAVVDPVVAAIGRRVKANFDPDGRLNPGRSA